jgi:Zn-dependent peptidase ImmA (M78 family)
MSDVALLQNEMSPQEMVFSLIKNNVDKLLPEDKNILSENPYVDIEGIANDIGIHIQRVPSELISSEHAKLKKIFIDEEGTRKEKYIIYVNNDDVPEEQRFSIAHEIYHFISDHTNDSSYRINVKSSIFSKLKNIIISKAISESKAEVISKEIAKEISDVLEKYVSEKKALIIFDKFVKPMYETLGKSLFFDEISIDDYISKFDVSNESMKKVIYDAKIETLNEEIADYFAANLVVPTERFILWEYKSDEEIATAFGVTVECIKKRKEEIENELYFMAPKDLASDVKIEEMVPLTPDELDSMLEDCSIHDTESI